VLYTTRGLFRSSVILALVCTMVLSREYFLNLRVPRVPTLDRLTGSLWLDPLAVHLYSGILAIVLILIGKYWLRMSEHRGSLLQIVRVAVITTIIFVAILGSAIVLTDYWLKPTFHYDRPSEEYRLPEPPFTETFNDLLNREPEADKPTSAPSGFVLRQLFLMLLLFILAQVTFLLLSSRLPRWRKAIIVLKSGFYSLNILMFCWVAFSRVWRGNHTIFDVGISIAVGILIFWPSFFLLASILRLIILKRRNLSSELGSSIALYSSEFVFPGLILLGFSFGLSNKPTSWGLASGVTLSILGLAYLLSHTNTTPKEES